MREYRGEKAVMGRDKVHGSTTGTRSCHTGLCRDGVNALGNMAASVKNVTLNRLQYVTVNSTSKSQP